MKLDKRPKGGDAHQKGLRAMVAKLADLDAEFARLTSRQLQIQRELTAVSIERDSVIARAYMEPGASLTTVARRFSLHHSRVQQILQRHAVRLSQEEERERL